MAVRILTPEQEDAQKQKIKSLINDGFDPQKPLLVQFIGGGQDSIALAYHSYYNQEFRDQYIGDRNLLFIMSDTGNEFDETYEAVADFSVWCQSVGIPFILITSDMGYHSIPWQNLLHQMERNDSLMYVAGRKSCTDNLKIKPAYRFLEEYLREAYGYKATGYRVFYQYHFQFGKLETWIGFAKGEESRVAEPEKELILSCGDVDMQEEANDEEEEEETEEPKKTSLKLAAVGEGQLSMLPAAAKAKKQSSVPKWRLKTVFHNHPLIALGWDRAKCQEMIASYGKPVPVPSNCMMCPFQNEAEVVFLYRTRPDVYQKWVERETAKLKKNAHRTVNFGVKGPKISLEQYLQKALVKYGSWTVAQLAEYRFTHGHCVKSRY